MKIFYHHFSFFLLFIFAVGCGSGNVSVTGKVMFPDGTPLDHGEVIFESSVLIARGAIQRDGTYRVQSGELKGLPVGTYNVSVGGFQDTVVESFAPDGSPTGVRIIPAVIPVAKKFLSGGTSDLVCEVKGRTTFDITVEPPK